MIRSHPSFLKNENLNSVEKIFITASGGPFLNLSYSKMKKINPSIAIKHPKWKMGKKISIDSATMMNKVYEIIEAKRIFKSYTNRFDILIHPKSYIHAIVKFKNGLIKIIAHDTNMKIPISNSIYESSNKNQIDIVTSKYNYNYIKHFKYIRNLYIFDKTSLKIYIYLSF